MEREGTGIEEAEDCLSREVEKPFGSKEARPNKADRLNIFAQCWPAENVLSESALKQKKLSFLKSVPRSVLHLQWDLLG